MAVYNFTISKTFGLSPRQMSGDFEGDPHISPYAPGMAQSSHIDGRVKITGQEGQVSPEEVEEFLYPGFRYLDAGMKHYWSDLRIPTNDSYRFARVKIAGAAKSLQIWIDELKNGRVKLPVISISRTAHEYNPQKFTPPYLPIRKNFVAPDRSRVALHYRPVPYLVNYTINIWSEHKRDAEYLAAQVNTRFNPLAEVRLSDGVNMGNVQMRYGNWTDDSEKEAEAEQHAKIKYQVNFIAEAWLPLPEKIVPTILGRHVAVDETFVRSNHLF